MLNTTHMINFNNGYFEVIEYNGKDPKYNAHTWKCKCKCGKIVILRTNVIKSASTKSCGCARKNPFVKGHPYGRRFKPTHGLSKHPLFRTWSHIIDRCYYLIPDHTQYRYYKGKGIKMCDEWKKDFKKFYDWAISHGWEKGLTIDRKDANGNYEPTNCEFVTRSENSKRMAINNPKHGMFSSTRSLDDKDVMEIRNKLKLGINGAEIAREFKVHRKTIYDIRDAKTWNCLV